jgi:acylphosphatase
MNKLLKIIKQNMQNGSVKICLEGKPNANKLLLTTTQNLKAIQAENELVRNHKFCKVLNTYRDGKKQGMQIIKTEVLDLSEVLNSELGDNSSPLMTEREVTFVNPNDTAL